MEAPAAIAGVIGAVSFTGLGLYLLRRRPLAGFGILFFLINLLPEALLVPQYLFVVYRAMLPMVGILIAGADGLNFVLGEIRHSRLKTTLKAAFAIVLTFSVALMAWSTVLKARAWQDPIVLWNDVVSHLPEDHSKLEKLGTLQSLNSLGTSLQRAGKNAEAIAYHLRALEVTQMYDLSHAALANAYAGAGEKEKAEQSYRNALELYPNSDKINMGLANLLIRQGRNEDAKPYLKKAVERAPDNPEYQSTMGLLLLKEGSYPEALMHLGKALELKPNDGKAHFHLGKVLSKMGKNKEAAVQYTKALELEPTNWQAHNDLGIMLAKAGRIEDAVFHFQEALRANPDEQSVKANLGNALKEMESVPKK